MIYESKLGISMGPIQNQGACNAKRPCPPTARPTGGTGSMRATRRSAARSTGCWRCETWKFHGESMSMVIFPLKMVIFPLKMMIFPLKIVISQSKLAKKTQSTRSFTLPWHLPPSFGQPRHCWRWCWWWWSPPLPPPQG